MIVCTKKRSKNKETPVSINTIKQAVNRAKSLIEILKKGKGLPFQDELSRELIEKHVSRVTHRERIFSPEMTVHTFLSQVISADSSCQAAVAQAAAHAASQGRDISVNTAAYCKARLRLPEAIFSGLTRDCAKDIEEKVPEAWLWRGRPVKLLDGSCVSMPDTAKNQAAYPQPASQKKGVGFPLARLVAVISLATGAVLDLAIGPYAGKCTGENALLRQLLPVFQEGDIALGDCYYASFF
jgi:ABC-type transporter Mla MlaB component